MKVAKRIFPVLLALGATGVIAVLATGMGAYYYLAPGLPSADTIRDVRLQIPLRVYTRDGRLIEQFGERRRTPKAFEDIPPIVANAFLAAEDDRFYDHPGFDYQGITRAAVNLLLTGSRAQGGSTITQQLAREYFLTRDRTFVRKAKELILALQIEKEFSKEEILELYLNKIFLGQRAYGVAAAAQVYFGKELEKLEVAEAATLAGLPKAPSTLNPVANPTRAIERRTYVLRRMKELSFIDQETYETSLNFPMVSRVHGRKVDIDAPYVAAMASKNMKERFGQNEAFTGGYKVITTIDSRQQASAHQALRNAVLAYDQRHGYRGPVDLIDLESLGIPANEESLAVVTEAGANVADAVLTFQELENQTLQTMLEAYPAYTGMKLALILTLNEDNSADVFISGLGRRAVPWENLMRSPYVDDSTVGDAPETVGDMFEPGHVIRLMATDDDAGWRLVQMPEAQGAIAAMDPFDGAITALSGGFDFALSKFNRASQSPRQPGSAIKPFIYSAALENGFTAATIVKDAPIVINDKNLEAVWRPENYSGKFYGDTRLREGLVRSMNLVSLQTLRRVGITTTIEHMRRFGLPKAGLPKDLTLALGSGSVTMLDLVGAYAGLASGGHYIRPYIIERIEDVDGNVVYQAEPKIVCDPCSEHWFDGRETKLDENDLEFVETGEPDEQAATMLDEDNWFSNDEPMLPPLDTEVPDYADIDEMIAQAAEWRPDASETPLFFAGIEQAERIISAENAYIIYDMMRDVVRRGTGRSIRDLGRNDLAGKTGTTNEGKDTWFGGFNGELAAAVRIGFDAQERSLGRSETGGKTALPMWKEFFGEVLKDQDETPLKQPDGIVTVRISATTGKLARVGDSGTRFEIFAEGTVPELEEDTESELIDETVDEFYDDDDIF